ATSAAYSSAVDRLCDTVTPLSTPSRSQTLRRRSEFPEHHHGPATELEHVARLHGRAHGVVRTRRHGHLAGAPVLVGQPDGPRLLLGVHPDQERAVPLLLAARAG